ncbi:MAG: hypothetical protein IT201_09540 [Thermoleophilia bacterium]|nr:hypothetical protein [Thermoleophilia bacterium]
MNVGSQQAGLEEERGGGDHVVGAADPAVRSAMRPGQLAGRAGDLLVEGNPRDRRRSRPDPSEDRRRPGLPAGGRQRRSCQLELVASR